MNSQCCLVHCKMGISRSASTVSHPLRPHSFTRLPLGPRLSDEREQPLGHRRVGLRQNTPIVYKSERRLQKSAVDLRRNTIGQVRHQRTSALRCPSMHPSKTFRSKLSDGQAASNGQPTTKPGSTSLSANPMVIMRTQSMNKSNSVLVVPHHRPNSMI